MYDIIYYLLVTLTFLLCGNLVYGRKENDPFYDPVVDPANSLDADSWKKWFKMLTFSTTGFFLLTVIMVMMYLIFGSWDMIIIYSMMVLAPYSVLMYIVERFELIDDLVLRFFVVLGMSCMFAWAGIYYPGQGTHAIASFFFLAMFLLELHRIKLRPYLTLITVLVVILLVLTIAFQLMGEFTKHELAKILDQTSEQWQKDGRNMYIDFDTIDRVMSGLLAMIAYRQSRELGTIALLCGTLIGYFAGACLYALLTPPVLLVGEMTLTLPSSLLGYFLAMWYSRLKWSQLTMT